MKVLFLLILMAVSSCSQLRLKVDDKNFSAAKFIKKEKYIEVQGAGDILRAVSAATVMIRFRQTGDQTKMQDLISISIGSDQPTTSSRASLRLAPGGLVAGIARAKDTDEGQNVISSAAAAPGVFHSAALVVDYETNEMLLYLDGKPIDAKGSVKFGAKVTADSPSANIALGAEDNGSSSFFEGELQNPQVWRRRLSPEEILSYSQK